MSSGEVRRAHRLITTHVATYFNGNDDLADVCCLVLDRVLDHGPRSVSSLTLSDLEALLVNQSDGLPPGQQLVFGRAISIVASMLKLWTSSDQVEAFLDLRESYAELRAMSTGNFAVLGSKESPAPPCAWLKPRAKDSN